MVLRHVLYSTSNSRDKIVAAGKQRSVLCDCQGSATTILKGCPRLRVYRATSANLGNATKQDHIASTNECDK